MSGIGWEDLRKFVPAELATRMAEAGGTIADERRVVTVLFADLSGFTAMSEQLDAESVHRVMNAVLARLSEVVFRYEGTIDKFIGDEVMALFGAPIAHEDDPVRALHAALEMRAALEAFDGIPGVRLPTKLRMHAGIHTGEVIAGNVGHDLRLSYSVIGDTVNLAARLEGASEAGQIFISRRTRALVGDRFLVRELPPLRLKGKSAPVEVFELLAAQAIPVPAPAAPLVGRAEELSSIAAALAEARHRRGGRLAIVAEAGMGKTRLVAEAARNARVAAWGRGDPYAAGRPFLPVTQAVRALVGIEPTDDAEVIDVRLRTWGALHGWPAERRPWLDLLIAGPGADVVAPEERRAALAELAKRCTPGTMLLIEDLHWADPATIELLATLDLSGSGVLLVVTSRDPCPGPGLTLGPLDPADAARMADERLPTPLPPAVRAHVVAKAAGHPLYIAQLVQALVESGRLVPTADGWRVEGDLDEIPLPETLTSLLQARVDAVDFAAREALRSAAVMGYAFSSMALPAAQRDRLGFLEERKFVVRAESGGAFDWRFDHALIRDVVARSVLHEHKKALHKAVATAFEAHPARDQHAEWLATQFEAAEVWDKAAEYAAQAAREATKATGRLVSPALAEPVASKVVAGASVSSLLLAVGMWAASGSFVLIVLVGFQLLTADPLVSLPLALYLAVLVPSAIAWMSPASRIRAVVVGADAITLHRSIGSRVVKYADLVAVRWDRAPGIVGQLTTLGPFPVGEYGQWELGRDILLGFGQEIALVGKGGTTRFLTGRSPEVISKLRDALEDRKRSGHPEVPITGTFSAWEWARRVWLRDADGTERGSRTYAEIVDGIAEGRITGADAVALPRADGVREWVDLDTVGAADRRILRALRPYTLVTHPQALPYAFAVAAPGVTCVGMLAVWGRPWAAWWAGSFVAITASVLSVAVLCGFIAVLEASRPWMSRVVRRTLITAAGTLGFLAVFPVTLAATYWMGAFFPPGLYPPDGDPVDAQIARAEACLAYYPGRTARQYCHFLRVEAALRDKRWEAIVQYGDEGLADEPTSVFQPLVAIAGAVQTDQPTRHRLEALLVGRRYDPYARLWLAVGPLASTTPNMWARLAEARAKDGDAAGADEAIREMLALDPERHTEVGVMWYAGHAAHPDPQGLAAAWPDQAPRALRKLGDELFDARRLAEARVAWTMAAERGAARIDVRLDLDTDDTDLPR